MTMTTTPHLGSTLDVTGAADLMKIHPNTVLLMIEKGTLPAAKIGRAYVLLYKDVLAHIERQIVMQTAQRQGGPRPKRAYRRRGTLSPELVR